MNFDDAQERKVARERIRRRRTWLRRLGAVGSLAVVIAAIAAIAIGATGGSSSKSAATNTAASAGHQSQGTGHSTPSGAPAGQAGTATVPILVYHVIAPAPSGTSSPGLYVPEAEFSAQMQALKTAGWHAVTMNQLQANWTRGVSLGAGKPIVISFDTGYHSQYANALPVLKQLGWVGNVNLQLNGLPPAEGGIADPEIRGLVSAGWELDSQGGGDADLVGASASQLQNQTAGARQTMQQRYGVPVDWFSYPSGDYDSTVIAAVKAAGFVGATTVVSGWASPSQDRFRLPRLRVAPATTPPALLSQIASAQSAPAPPDSFTG